MTMSKQRYMELSCEPNTQLTQEEIEEGWFFCNCEWDGMLLHKDEPEAKFCGCIKAARDSNGIMEEI